MKLTKDNGQFTMDNAPIYCNIIAGPLVKIKDDICEDLCAALAIKTPVQKVGTCI